MVSDTSGFEPPDSDEGELTEGVRIIRPEEAAERLGADRTAPRERPSSRRRRQRGGAGSESSSRPAMRFPSSDAGSGQGPTGEEPADEDVGSELGDEPDEEKRSLFSVDDTGNVELPHWTEPATGEVPRVVVGDEPPGEDEDAEAWASLASSAPRWRGSADDWDDDVDDLAALGDDEIKLGALDSSDRPTDDDLFSFDDIDKPPPRAERGPSPTAAPEEQRPPRRRPAGAPPGASRGRPAAARPGARRRPPTPGGRSGPGAGAQPEPEPERNIPMAIAAGVLIGVVALIFFALGSTAAMILVVIVVGFAAAEFFTVIGQAGYRPAHLLGLTAAVAFPLAAYWRGESAYPVVIFLTMLFLFLWYLVGAGEDSPTAGMGVTLLGVVWVGALGGFAALMLAAPDGVSLLLAVAIAAVAYDVGAFAVGRSIGQSPLSAASPNKTIEGVAGGVAVSVVVTVLIVGVFPKVADGIYGGEFWNSILLGLVVSVAATLGDLSESVLKRDLGVKDMGSLIPGHGGVLDRFDGILFTLPAAYYLTRILV